MKNVDNTDDSKDNKQDHDPFAPFVFNSADMIEEFAESFSISKRYDPFSDDDLTLDEIISYDQHGFVDRDW